MKRTLVLLLAITFTLTACGGDNGPSKAEKEAQAAASASASASASAAAEAKKAYEAKKLTYDECAKWTAKGLDEMDTVDSRLDIGILFNDFNTALGDIQAAVDKNLRKMQDEPGLIDRLKAGPCAKVFKQMDASQQAWFKAMELWSDCIYDIPGCDTQKGETSDKISAGLGRGSEFVKKAHKALRALKPSDPATPTPSPSPSGLATS